MSGCTVMQQVSIFFPPPDGEPIEEAEDGAVA
jgi:hypothetical protein